MIFDGHFVLVLKMLSSDTLVIQAIYIAKMCQRKIDQHEKKCISIKILGEIIRIYLVNLKKLY